MPVLFLLLALAAQPNVGPAKLFSGRIVLTQRFEDPKTHAALSTFNGHKLDALQRYEIAGNNYRSFNEAGLLVQLYRGDENVYYSVSAGKPQPRDAGKPTYSVRVIRRSSETQTVLGRKCRRIDVETDDGAVTTYYFDPDGPRVDVKAFRRHAFGGWNRYLEATDGALSLRTIVHHPEFTFTLDAVSIEEVAFRPADFELATALAGGKPVLPPPTR